MANWHVHPDGSFDLVTPHVSLRGAYPSINGVSLRATAVVIERSDRLTTVVYTTSRGFVELRLAADHEGTTIEARLLGWKSAPRSFEVIDGAVLVGVTRVFKQAHGMAGGSGLTDLQKGTPIESFGITALVGEGKDALILYSLDHAQFEQRTRVAEASSSARVFNLTAGFQTEGVALSHDRLDLPALHLSMTNDHSIGLRHAAEAIARTMNVRPSRPASYHWCSWYYNYQNLDMSILREYLDGFEKVATKRPLDFIQIDAGYAPSTGDWLLPSHRFPGTLQPAFDLIRSRGHRPGVWIGPFMVGNRSQLARDHPGWLLHDNDGNRVTPWRHYEENRVWGYRDEETYVLDTSHPDAFDYLRTVFRTLREWGAQMFKTDFMFWGLQDSTKVRRHTPGKTSVEYFRDVLKMIRQEIGEETFWLGCIAPYMPFIGYADAMRIGGDVGASWTGGFGPQNMLRETVGSQHFNNVFWQNDPDVLLIRDFHNNLNEDQVTSLALWQSILGGVVATSDPLHEIAESRRALWRFVQPSSDCAVATLPFLTQRDRPLVAVRSLATGDHIVLVFNSSDRPVRECIRLSELGIGEKRYVFTRDIVASTRVGYVDEMRVTLRPHASVDYHLATRDIAPDGPLLLPEFPERP